MKPKIYAILLAALTLCFCLTGCGDPVEEYTETAKTLFTRLYTYPNDAIIAYDKALEEAPVIMDESGRFGYTDAKEANRAVIQALFGEEVDAKVAEKLLNNGLFVGEQLIALDTGESMAFEDVTLTGEGKNYSYTATVSYTDSDGNTSVETMKGSIQFDDAGKINYLVERSASFR